MISFIFGLLIGILLGHAFAIYAILNGDLKFALTKANGSTVIANNGGISFLRGEEVHGD